MIVDIEDESFPSTLMIKTQLKVALKYCLTKLQYMIIHTCKQDCLLFLHSFLLCFEVCNTYYYSLCFNNSV